MLGKTRHRYLASLALALTAVAAPPAAATPVQDPIPIGPNMYFIALVNGHTSPTPITVVCPGPISSNSTGHPISGQTLEVRAVLPVTTTVGYTGSAAHSIDAIFTSPTGAVTNPPVVLTSFFAPVPIPTTLNLPCSGSGVISFVPIPTSPTARGVAFSVTYLNIGA